VHVVAAVAPGLGRRELPFREAAGEEEDAHTLVARNEAQFADARHSLKGSGLWTSGIRGRLEGWRRSCFRRTESGAG
jgi:hypothetical protein